MSKIQTHRLAEAGGKKEKSQARAEGAERAAQS